MGRRRVGFLFFFAGVPLLIFFVGLGSWWKNCWARSMGEFRSRSSFVCVGGDCAINGRGLVVEHEIKTERVLFIETCCMPRRRFSSVFTLDIFGAYVLLSLQLVEFFPFDNGKEGRNSFFFTLVFHLVASSVTKSCIRLRLNLKEERTHPPGSLGTFYATMMPDTMVRNKEI